MGSAERRERERQELQTQILDAARGILLERGYEGVTMRAVADKIEYSAAALYKHFADRESIVQALCARDFYAFGQEMNARVGTAAKDPLELLRQIGRSYAEFALSHPEQYRVMFMTPVPKRDQIEFPYGDPKSDAYALLSLAVEGAQKKGHFPGLDKDLIAQTMWSAMHGAISLEIVICGAKENKHIPYVPIAERTNTALESSLLGLEELAKRAHKKPRPTSARRSR
jgi:AcrR family transcriptional regulator